MGSRGPLAGQAPLHRLHAPGIVAGGDDAEIGARLLERVRMDRQENPANHDRSKRSISRPALTWLQSSFLSSGILGCSRNLCSTCRISSAELHVI